MLRITLHISLIALALLSVTWGVPPPPPSPDQQARGRSGRPDHTTQFLARTGVPPMGVPLPPMLVEEEDVATHGCEEEEPHCDNFFSQRYPTAEGTCNNRVNPRRGARDRSFKRLLLAKYNDEHDSLRLSTNGSELPSARLISNSVQGGLNTNNPSTHMLPFWGQFLVHDIALTLEPEGSVVECECSRNDQPECVNIPIPRGDIQYRSDLARRKTCFTTERSEPVADSEDCSSFVRQQLNEISAYLDMGLVYGNSEEHLEAIRTHTESLKGELTTVDNNVYNTRDLLPDSAFPNISAAASVMFCPQFVRKPLLTSCRVSGEARTNENSVLQSHHTVWMRTHNIIAKELKRHNPDWSSDRIMQVSKLIVTALHQRVTFEHFLPVILGSEMMKRFDLNLLSKGYYYGYDSTYSAGVSNSFTTAAFRMGHTLINQFFSRPSNRWSDAQAEAIRVKTSLFNVGQVTSVLNSGGPNSFIRGLANDSALNFDSTFSDDLRNFLFSPNFSPTTFGADLLARNIQRGRDHGIPTYVEVRIFCGFSEPKSFSDLSDFMTRSMISKLQSAYGDVRDIDLFAGGIAERSVEGGTVGPTFACLIAYQFRDLKKGDRFWHENAPPVGSFTRAQLAAIRAVPFPRLLCMMVPDMRTIQAQPMQKVSAENPRQNCGAYASLDLSAFSDPVSTPHVDEVEQSTDGTSWFTTRIDRRGRRFTVSELYQWLIINRPNEVCRQVTSTRTKLVQEETQVRFRCLPGTIPHSDFPPVLSEKYFWTRWYTGSATPFATDYQVTPEVTECKVPYAIQAQTLTGVPAGETGDVFNQFSATEGLVCFGSDQESDQCSQYRVRFLCFRKR